MFADNTNLLCRSKTVKTRFLIANIELKKIWECFRANKLSLNEDKASSHFFTNFKIEITCLCNCQF